MQIVDLADKDEISRKTIAQLLLDGFTTAWPNKDEAYAEVSATL
jgi:hypothetical protein